MSWKLDRVAWLDCETTGIEPEVDLLLEVAIIVTDADLKEVGRESLVIVHTQAELDAVIDRDDRDPDTNAFIRDMHAASGLLEECQGLRDACPVDAEEADWRLCQVLMRDVEDKGAKFPLGGCSGWIDRSMVRLHLPQLYDRISHKSIDASGYKTALVNWAGINPRTGEPKVYPHRALPDCVMAIERTQAMRRFLIRAARAVPRRALAELTEAMS